jgi:hypothetical protein
MKMFRRGIVILSAVAVLAGCSGDGGGGGSAVSDGTANVISAKGGAGVASSPASPSTVTGGSGGYFGIWTYDGNKVVIKKSGSVDTSFDTSYADQLVASSALTFGAVPLEVTQDLTIKAYQSGDDSTVSAGEFHFHVDDSIFYRRNDAGNGDDPVTGIHVHAARTLTFALNYNTMFNTGLDLAWIQSLPNDIWNQGTITTMNVEAGANEEGSAARIPDGTSLDQGNLEIRTDGVWLNEGTITTEGGSLASAATTTNGGRGGSFSAWGGILFINQGMVTTSGGDGASGGNAGRIDLLSGYGTWSSGAVAAAGGIGHTDEGGSGEYIQLWSQEFTGTVYNTAELDASGGAGATSGGNSGNVVLQSDNGDVVNAGRLRMNGGSVTDAGNGGRAADGAYFGAYGGNIRNSGIIEMTGGNGKGDGSQGGAGGYLDVFTSTASDPYDGFTIPAGSIKFSGSILADAGSGETGGDNSESWIAFFHDSSPAVGDIELVGYGSINISGGDGRDDGGSGGGVEIYGGYGQQYAMFTFKNEADILAAGGEGGTGSGGSGGYAYVDAYDPGDGNPTEQFMVDNLGTVSTSGGKGVTSGGDAGYLYFYASQGIRNAGRLSAMGGAASSPTVGAGGQGNYVDLWALSHIMNSGAIDSSGGNGALTGGHASWNELYSEYGAVQNSGNMSANGGNADATLAGSVGGDAADIYLYSSNSGGPYETTNTGNVQANGGTGETPGNDGTITVSP